MSKHLFSTILYLSGAFLLASCGESGTTISSDNESSSSVEFSSSSVNASLSSSSVNNQQSTTCVYSESNNTLTCSEKTYKTVVIGTQTWMAENLNATPANGNSWCYNLSASNCDIYGRLYDWATAKTACPTGWHLPSNDDWKTLTTYVGGVTVVGTKLKANQSLWSTNTGTDDFGFSGLPGGSYNGTSFNGIEYYGYWWSETSYETTNAYTWSLVYNYAGFIQDNYFGQQYGFSVRCLQDSP